ncbi:putative efflux protein, MATE family [Paenibacillus sp. UNCCL117]|uniref:MATE family efflux transporter n=1 Tax=unclassified Paenibacillus TaxID=185978 RepID=UPI00088F69B5|nr:MULTISPECIES: MATE family efflux transporter [unclassified Paenibacillus]SDD05860.1 putative efflux protein, MATE family [Paenibacillus sp. cl123]SFW31812.1 putative efflux protein, MATE family [Paenibacillus sp. UNCCL117]
MLKDGKKLTLAALTWPIFVEMLLSMLMGNADTLMLSHYSDGAVAAVGVANQVLFLVNLMFGVVAAGTSVVISQYLGSGRNQEAGLIGLTAMALNLAFGLLLAALLLASGAHVFRLMGIPAELTDSAWTYLKLVGGFCFLEAVRLTLATILRSYGYTSNTMYVAVGMNLLHLIGNYLFLYGPFGLPVLGIEGIALSTNVSRLIGIGILLLLLYRKVKYRFVSEGWWSAQKNYVKQLLRIGVPTAGESFFSTLAQMAITSFVAIAGADALTAKIYAQNIGMFNMLFTLSMAIGTEILLGRMVGAGRFDEAYARGMRSVRLAVIVTVGAAAVMAAGSRPLLGLFTDNASILSLGFQVLLLGILLEPGRAVNLVLINALRAAGDAKVPMYLGVGSMWLICIPLAYILGVYGKLGLLGVVIAFVVDEWTRGALFYWRWRTRAWERMRIVGEVEEGKAVPF